MGVPYLFSTALIIIGTLTVYPVGCYATEVSDNGLGKDYNWFSLEDGLMQAKNQRKPLMLIIHKSWCGACKGRKASGKSRPLKFPSGSEAEVSEGLRCYYNLQRVKDSLFNNGATLCNISLYQDRTLAEQKFFQELRSELNRKTAEALKPEFAASIGIKALSSKFVMVNTMDSEEPADKIYAPDGGYIPRILFLTPDGEVLEDITNEEGNPSYKYYYFNVNDIISSMKKVIDLYKSADIQDEL